jgi:hypothetical protein
VTIGRLRRNSWDKAEIVGFGGHGEWVFLGREPIGTITRFTVGMAGLPGLPGENMALTPYDGAI